MKSIANEIINGKAFMYDNALVIKMPVPSSFTCKLGKVSCIVVDSKLRKAKQISMLRQLAAHVRNQEAA